MNNSRKSLLLARVIARHMSKSAEPVKEVVHPKFQKLKEIQKRFGVDDGVPIYLKKGLSDRLLYGFTVALVGVGLGMSFEVMWKLTFKDA